MQRDCFNVTVGFHAVGLAMGQHVCVIQVVLCMLYLIHVVLCEMIFEFHTGPHRNLTSSCLGSITIHSLITTVDRFCDKSQVDVISRVSAT